MAQLTTHPAEARLRLVLSQEFLRTRLDEEEGGSCGEERSVLRADEGEWRLSKSAISLQNGQTDARVTNAIKYRIARTSRTTEYI